MRQRASKILRVLSYLGLAASVAGLAWAGNGGGGTACSSMSCMGSGLGEAILWLFMAIGLFGICVILNIAAFFTHPGPTSLGRKIEAALFVLPVAGVVALLLQL